MKGTTAHSANFLLKETLAIGMALGGLAFPHTARAELFTLNQSQLLQLWDVFENPESTSTNLSSKVPDGDGVLFSGTLFDTPGNPFSPFAQIGIGANATGFSSTGSGPTLAEIVETPGEQGTADLSNFDGYALSLTNADDQSWSVSLYMNAGLPLPPFSEPNIFYQTGFTSLAPGESTTLVLNFDALGVINRSRTTNLGFQVGGNLIGPNPDNFQLRARAATVPEPVSTVAWLVFAAAASGVRQWRSRD